MQIKLIISKILNLSLLDNRILCKQKPIKRVGNGKTGMN